MHYTTGQSSGVQMSSGEGEFNSRRCLRGYSGGGSFFPTEYERLTANTLSDINTSLLALCSFLENISVSLDVLVERFRGVNNAAVVNDITRESPVE